jgi:hypothetical protein
MLAFWDDEAFWDQVVIGYTGMDLSTDFNMNDGNIKKWRKNKM